MSTGDAKLDAYNTQSFSKVKLCVGTTELCYSYDLGQTYSNAAKLFNGNFKRTTNMDKRKFTDLWLSPGSPDYDYFWNGGSGANCGMQRPGFNTQCNDGNDARWGYCVNHVHQGCQQDDSQDADSVIGIGLYIQHQTQYSINAGFGEKTMYQRSPDQYNNKQVWVFLHE